MSEAPDLSSVRAAALDRIDRAQRRYRLAILGGVTVEALFIAGFLVLADLSNRLHVLLLLATVATYTIVGIGLIALGAHVSRCTGRVLAALRLVGHQD